MTTTGDDRAIVLLVELFVHPGRVAEFRRFETEASIRTEVTVGIDGKPYPDGSA